MRNIVTDEYKSHASSICNYIRVYINIQTRTFIRRRHSYLRLIKEFRESPAGKFKYARRVPTTAVVADVVVGIVVVSRNEIKAVGEKEREGHLSVLLITAVRVLATGTFWDARALLFGILCLPVASLAHVRFQRRVSRKADTLRFGRGKKRRNVVQ